MTDAALGGGAFDSPPFIPAWQRPAVVAIVIALHAAALATLPRLASIPRATPEEVIVDIQPETPPSEPLTPTSEPERPPPPTLPPPPQAIEPPAAEIPPVAEPPPVAESPPQPEPPPAPTPVAPEPPLPPPEPPAPVELAPPKPPPPPPRVEKPPSKPTPKPQPKPAPARPIPAQGARTPPSTNAPAPAAASAASLSAYVAEMSAAIRGRLFYPPAARARGAKGVVGVAFTISSSGAVASFAITHSSGDSDLDAAARTLVQSTHFSPPPGGSARVSTSFNYVPR